MNLDLPTDAELIAAAPFDPRAEVEKLTAGNPGEIGALGAAFVEAGGAMDEALQLSTEAQQWIGGSYLADDDQVYDYRTHAASLPAEFPDAGANLARIGRDLHDIGEMLATSIRTAVEEYDAVFVESFPAIRADWAATVRAATNAFGLIPHEALDGILAQHRALSDQMHARTGELGTTINGLVTTYEDRLARGTASLTDLGYFAPDVLDSGPGPGLSAAEAGEADAQTVQEALAMQPGTNSLGGINAGLHRFQDIQDRLEAGGELTQAERDYVHHFSATLGEDGFVRLDDHVRDAALAERGTSLPFSSVADRAAADVRYAGVLSPLGTAVTAMADGTVGLEPGTTGQGSGAVPPGTRLAGPTDLPPQIRGLLDTRLGVAGPDGRRYANQASIPPWEHGFDADAVLAGGVAGQDRINTASGILLSSTVEPSPALAHELARDAVRIRQDLNAVQEATARQLVTPGYADANDPAELAQLDAHTHDRWAGDLLAVAARSNEGSSMILTDDALRAPLLGLNWEDHHDQGAAYDAAAVVAAGTNRDPAAGGGTHLQARAALAVTREMALDPVGYPQRMAAPVTDAVVRTGVDHIDAFAAAPVKDPDEGIIVRNDALGDPRAPTFKPTHGETQGFLRMVQASGDDRADAFGGAAELHSRGEMAAAFHSGDATKIEDAMRDAGRLRGAINRAVIDHQLGGSIEADALARAGHHASTDELTRAHTAENMSLTASRATFSFVPGAGPVINAAVGAYDDWNRGQQAIERNQPPPAEVTDYVARDATNNVEHWRILTRDLSIAAAMGDAGLFTDRPLPASITAGGTLSNDPEAQEHLTIAVSRSLAEMPRSMSTAPWNEGHTQTYTTDGHPRPPVQSAWNTGDRLYYGDVAQNPAIPRPAYPRDVANRDYVPPGSGGG